MILSILMTFLWMEGFCWQTDSCLRKQKDLPQIASPILCNSFFRICARANSYHLMWCQWHFHADSFKGISKNLNKMYLLYITSFLKCPIDRASTSYDHLWKKMEAHFLFTRIWTFHSEVCSKMWKSTYDLVLNYHQSKSHSLFKMFLQVDFVRVCCGFASKIFFRGRCWFLVGLGCV